MRISTCCIEEHVRLIGIFYIYIYVYHGGVYLATKPQNPRSALVPKGWCECVVFMCGIYVVFANKREIRRLILIVLTSEPFKHLSIVYCPMCQSLTIRGRSLLL